MNYMYLDHWGIRNLAVGKVESALAAKFADLQSRGLVTVVVSQGHVDETALDPDVGRRPSIMAYVDNLFHKVWRMGCEELHRAEVESCFAVFTGSEPAAIVPFSPIPGRFSDRVASLSSDTEQLEKLRRSKANWRATRLVGRRDSQRKPMPDALRRRLLMRYVPSTSPAGTELSEPCRHQFLAQLEISGCPATQLEYEVNDKLNAEPEETRVDPGDVYDHAVHLCAIPYCDVTTLDAHMHSIVLQTQAGKLYAGRIAPTLQDALSKLGL